MHKQNGTFPVFRQVDSRLPVFAQQDRVGQFANMPKTCRVLPSRD